MPDGFENLQPQLRKPTAERPLSDITLLVIEDSKFASDAVRLMALHSGARLRRADCLASARRHLAVYRPSVVMIDLGLPDGSGVDLIQELVAAEPRVPAIIATSGETHLEQTALDAGADDFLAKPIAGIAAFQHAILKCLPRDGLPPSPRLVSNATVAPDPVALRDDLAHVAALLSGPIDQATLDYIGQFIHSLGVSGDDPALLDVSSLLKQDPRPKDLDLSQLQALVRTKIENTAHI